LKKKRFIRAAAIEKAEKKTFMLLIENRSKLQGHFLNNKEVPDFFFFCNIVLEIINQHQRAIKNCLVAKLFKHSKLFIEMLLL